jgi:hypothetical protein
MKNYLSELTVETIPIPVLNESKMSKEVVVAVSEAQAYRADRHLAPLNADQRKAQVKQAEELLAWYMMGTGNDRPEGISTCDASKKNAWLQNTGGVIDTDGNPKISYFMLKNFIRDNSGESECDEHVVPCTCATSAKELVLE